MNNKIHAPLDILACKIVRCLEGDNYFDEIEVDGITYEFDVDYDTDTRRATGTSFMGDTERWDEDIFDIKSIELVSATKDGENVTDRVVFDPKALDFSYFDNISY